MKKRIDYTTLFGAVVMDAQMQKEKTEKTEKEREACLFEIVDDYVEQA